MRDDAADIVCRFCAEPIEEIRPLSGGLINETYLVETSSGRYVLQRLHKIFDAGTVVDTDAVTRYLAARGVATPLVVSTGDGDLYVSRNGSVWRMTTFIDGLSFDDMPSEGHAHEAGRALGKFHAAVADCAYSFTHRMPHWHDTPFFMRRLRETAKRYRDFENDRVLAPLISSILSVWDALEPLPALPCRVVHGDPKLNNVRFAH